MLQYATPSDDSLCDLIIWPKIDTCMLHMTWQTITSKYWYVFVQRIIAAIAIATRIIAWCDFGFTKNIKKVGFRKNVAREWQSRAAQIFESDEVDVE